MPRYVYECTKCGNTYEKLEGWDAKPRQRCPECKAMAQRIPAPPAIVFKGSGWYSTDNRRTLRDGADHLQAGKGDGESASDGGGEKNPAEAKADSKSDE